MTIARVIDFETTGQEPPAEVCEVGLCDVNVDRQTVQDPRAFLCGVREMPPEVRAVHHISLAETKGWPEFTQGVADEFMEGVSCIIAHNADFELKFFKPSVPVICTYKCGLRAWPDAPSHGNNALRYWLEDQGRIELDHGLTLPTHRAGPDAYVTAHIFMALLEAGITGKQMVEWTREHPMLPRCPIGKFRGKPWAEVESGFLSWMLKQADMEPGLKFNAEMELARRDGK